MMIGKMGREIEVLNYPVLSTDNGVAITWEDKAAMVVNSFVTIHSSNNLNEDGSLEKKQLKLEIWRL